MCAGTCNFGSLITLRLCAKVALWGEGGYDWLQFRHKNTRTEQTCQRSCGPTNTPDPSSSPPIRTLPDKHAFIFTLKDALAQSWKINKAFCSRPAAALFAKLTSSFTIRRPILIPASVAEVRGATFHNDQHNSSLSKGLHSFFQPEDEESPGVEGRQNTDGRANTRAQTSELEKRERIIWRLRGL